MRRGKEQIRIEKLEDRAHSETNKRGTHTQASPRHGDAHTDTHRGAQRERPRQRLRRKRQAEGRTCAMRKAQVKTQREREIV